MRWGDIFFKIQVICVLIVAYTAIFWGLSTVGIAVPYLTEGAFKISGFFIQLFHSFQRWIM